MPARKNGDEFHDMAAELLRAVRTFTDRPTPGAEETVLGMVKQYRRAWLGEDEPEPRQGPQLRPVEAA